jgi:hypothetical protein
LHRRIFFFNFLVKGQTSITINPDLPTFTNGDGV